MPTREDMQRYFWYFFGVLGVVLFWAGVWDGVGNISFLKNPLLSLIIGLILLFVGGIIRKTDNVDQQELVAHNLLREIHHHPQRHEFHVKYFDKFRKEEMIIAAQQLQRIEKGFLVLLEKGGKELFVPIHRVTEVLHNGKTYKKLK
ncbi:MAG TPA: RNA repair domain-containing protein [Candidatus Nanoarchaeia archaeon]|nr:RNA repair domain-containing protein [Candidatus Nanoarchaeia archaeon]